MAADLGTHGFGGHIGTADSDGTVSEGPWEMLDLSPASSAAIRTSPGSGTKTT